MKLTPELKLMRYRMAELTRGGHFRLGATKTTRTLAKRKGF
mgnify:FL=1